MGVRAGSVSGARARCWEQEWRGDEGQVAEAVMRVNVCGCAV